MSDLDPWETLVSSPRKEPPMPARNPNSAWFVMVLLRQDGWSRRDAAQAIQVVRRRPSTHALLVNQKATLYSLASGWLFQRLKE